MCVWHSSCRWKSAPWSIFLWPQTLPNVATSRNIDLILCRTRYLTHRYRKIDALFRGMRRQPRRRAQSRSSSFNQYCDAIRRLLDGNSYLSQKRIANILSIHWSTMKQVSCADLLLRKVNFIWILHLLDDDQKSETVRRSTELLRFLESRSQRQLANVYTGD
jgi:hypothetical protein